MLSFLQPILLGEGVEPPFSLTWAARLDVLYWASIAFPSELCVLWVPF